MSLVVMGLALTDVAMLLSLVVAVLAAILTFALVAFVFTTLRYFLEVT